jgi:hypothetical protein
MAWTSTLTQMLTEVRNRGGYRRSTSLTDAILTGFINAGIAEVHDLIVKHNPDFVVTSADLATTAGVATVNLPSDFYKLRRADLVNGSRSSKLRPYQIDDETYIDEATIWDSGVGADRPRYALQAGTMRFVPIPSSVYTVRLWYVPHATRLVVGADVYNGVNGHEDLVYEHALLRAAERDRRPADEHRASIQRLEKRLLSALEARDQSEPEYLVDHGRSEWG